MPVLGAKRRLLFGKNDASSRGKVNLQPILPAVPFHRSREVLSTKADITKSAIFLRVTGQNDLVLSSFLDADPIIGEAVRWVEIEDEQKSCTFVDNDFVYFMFQRYVCLR